MPTGDVSVANIGTALPLSYGYFRATGMRLVDYTIPSTATTLPNMQIGFWDLGEGELDGCDALWINNSLQFAFDPRGNQMGASTVGITPTDTATTPTLNSFSFHTGCDAPVGFGPGFSSVHQWIDPLWQYVTDIETSLCYSRRAYYGIGWTPATDDSSDVSPVADFRGMRCRIFDGFGNQTGYGFTANPIWHAVDLYLRRAIKPEYAIDPVTGPDALTAAEASKFNWASIFASAQACDYILANGQPRFQGSYVFASGSTLASMLEQVYLCCRAYDYEYAGQIYIIVDVPKSSTFVVSAKHLAPGSIERDDTQVNQNANRYVGSFLELGLPAVSTIATISRTSTEVVIDTVNPNPCAVADIISVGGVTDPSFDASYLVSATPSDTEVDAAISGGVAASSTGGSIGYIQSRFSSRAPEISHIQHQKAQGQILPPNVTGTRLKRIKVNYDFASCTYDQANRLMKYEIYRDLGLDQTPYLPPFGITLSLYSEATDNGGPGGALRALKAQLQGDVITLDKSVLFEYAGDYEIMERYVNPIQQEVEDSTDGNFVTPTTRSGALSSGTDSNSGVLKLVLRSYNPSATIFTDVSDTPNASFQTVPGQLPYAGPGSGEGGTGGTTGYTASGTVTVTTSTEGNATSTTFMVSWTNIIIRLASGLTLTYTASSVTGIATRVGLYWYLSISDPSYSGAADLVVVTSAFPTAGPGVFNLQAFPAPGLGATAVYFLS